MAEKRKGKARTRYGDLRQHAARIVKLAEYPLHVNGAYLDDPERIPTFSPGRPKA